MTPVAKPRAESVVLRELRESDVEPCGQILYEAFNGIAQSHNFPPPFPNTQITTSLIETFFRNPGFYGRVAERAGTVIGSNFIDERTAITGLGPITVVPSEQDGGVGRMLMDALIRRSDEREISGIRLVQATYHLRSLSLYTKLGFVSREQFAVMKGTIDHPGLAGYTVRPLEERDLPACRALSIAVHGFDRSGELADASGAGSAFVTERDGALRAYTSGLGFSGHSVGETTEALCALLERAPRMPSLGVLIPITNYSLFRWCLEHGMRVAMPMTLMTRGLYQHPDGPYLPSVLY